MDRPNREKIVNRIIPKIHDKDICLSCKYFGDCTWLDDEGNWCLKKQTLIAQKVVALFPDIEGLKKQIDIKRDYAFGESLFGSPEHQAQMQAMVGAYDVVLNLIKDIGGK